MSDAKQELIEQMQKRNKGACEKMKEKEQEAREKGTPTLNLCESHRETDEVLCSNQERIYSRLLELTNGTAKSGFQLWPPKFTNLESRDVPRLVLVLAVVYLLLRLEGAVPPITRWVSPGRPVAAAVAPIDVMATAGHAEAGNGQ